MKKTAYLSAEIGFSPNVPTYCGGLGILAGDHLKAAADAGLPMVGVTLLYRKGYFQQHLADNGQQSASYPTFDPHPLLKETGRTVQVPLADRVLDVAVWRVDIDGQSGRVPVLLLDTDLPSNSEDDRAITHSLYGGDNGLRLLQELVLGFGGVAAVKALFPEHEHLHLNEGHCAFAPLALLSGGESIDSVRERCHFTTHTPVSAGHDRFSYDKANEVASNLFPENLKDLAGSNELSMSHLALNLSRTANGVSKLHGEVAQEMFPEHPIGHVTNGVHHLTWISSEMRRVFDNCDPVWRREPGRLQSMASRLSADHLWAAHRERKSELLSYVNGLSSQGFSPDLLTIGFARRAATYKRAALLFSDLERLAHIAEGRIQFVFSGKAHPKDTGGQAVIQEIFDGMKKLEGRVKVAYIPNYNMWSGALLTSGVDVWLNNPLRPHEASGTSGMKAALNGVPNASIADGWWAEGAVDDQNGWLLGDPENPDDARDADSLYKTLEHRILPAWRHADQWTNLMRNSIATGAHFTAHRMVNEYVENYYAK